MELCVLYISGAQINSGKSKYLYILIIRQLYMKRAEIFKSLEKKFSQNKGKTDYVITKIEYREIKRRCLKK